MFSVFRVIEVSRVSLGVGFCGVVFICRIDVIYRVEGGVCVVVWVIRNSCGGFFWIVMVYGINVICYFIIRGGYGCIVSIVVLSWIVFLWGSYVVVWIEYFWGVFSVFW